MVKGQGVGDVGSDEEQDDGGDEADQGGDEGDEADGIFGGIGDKGEGLIGDLAGLDEESLRQGQAGEGARGRFGLHLGVCLGGLGG